jgi:hypothetical protein
MMRRYISVIALLGILGATLASCRGLPDGPSLSNIVVANITLGSTTGNTALCCCRVSATATNNNKVPVHLTIKYSALDGIDQDPIATILQFVPDLRPGASRAVEAAGLIVPCDAVRDLRTEVDVRGVAYPPR